MRARSALGDTPGMYPSQDNLFRYNEVCSYVIIGNGITGATAAETLRTEDAAANITVITDDPFPLYYRPALKDYLGGKMREDQLWVRPFSFYQDRRIRLLTDQVVGVQVGQHTVQLRSGQSIGYSRLLLAHGARARSLTCPGLNLVGVTTLRTVADYQMVLSRLSSVRHIVVTGSGTLALETVEVLRHRGIQVTHLLRHRTLWSQVLDVTASDLVLQQEKRDGIDVRTEQEIVEIIGKGGQVAGVITTTGVHIPCEMVILAIGIDPLTDFPRSAGIACGRGVKVDDTMRTSAPDIYAAGDLVEITDPMTGRGRVIGQWYPAIQQARAAAYNMLDLLDANRPFRFGNFYNATFLYGLDFASVGLTTIPRDGRGYQEVVADPQPRTYQKVILKDSVPVGILALGDRRNVLTFKRAIDAQMNLSSVADRLFAPGFKLNEWLDSQGIPAPILSVSRVGAAAVKKIAYADAGERSGILKAQTITQAVLVPVTSPDVKSPHRETYLSQTKILTIGRQEGAGLVINHSSISPRHAEISYANGQYILHDLQSRNGTFVNERRLELGSAHILRPNDKLRFGLIVFTFHVREVNGMSSMPLQPHRELTIPGTTNTIPASAVTLLKEGPALIATEQGEIFPLKQGKRFLLGRGKSNDIVLSDLSISRTHAEVFPGPDGFYIRDLESSNGVLVNQSKIDNPHRLIHGDRITMGNTTMYFLELDDRIGRSFMAHGSLQNGAEPLADVTLTNSTSTVETQLKSCRRCGTASNNRARFCPNCGEPL